MDKVIIYPRFDVFYYSFYIKGIFDVFAKRNIQFSCKEFPYLSSYCLAVIIKGSHELRIVIDAYDGAGIRGAAAKSALEWCDVYGKVNLVSPIISKHLVEKCVPIGPSFPVLVWPFNEAWKIALQTYRPSGYRATREHFANYRRQYKYRLPLHSFVPGLASDNYIFFSSSIWTDEEAPNTNQYRALFIDSCKSLQGVTFEGGFSPTNRPEYAAKYKEYITRGRFPLSEWLVKTQRSALVFYTPAVWQSHTFKLAEFLALGKAIISTPISRELPAPLVHGHHIHYIDGSAKSFHDALLLMLNDRDYRNHLGRNAYNYYLTFLTPGRIIERLLNQRKSA